MRLPILATLLVAAPASAQVLPQFSIGNSGSIHTLSVRDPVDKVSVPFGYSNGGAMSFTGKQAYLGLQPGGNFDARLFTLPGTNSSNGTLVIQSGTINLQGKLTPFAPINLQYSGAPSDAGTDAIAFYSQATNTNSRGGNGFRFDTIAGTNVGGSGTQFTVGVSTYANCAAIQGNQCLASFSLAQSPTNTANSWGVFGAEFNSVNLAGDFGYARYRSALTHWTDVFQAIPESHDFLTGSGAGAYDTLASLVVAHSTDKSIATGWYTQSHNALLIEPDSVSGAGVGVQIAGAHERTTADPKFGVRVDDRWSDAAIDTRDAVIATGNAVTLGAGQAVCFVGGDGCVRWSGGKLTYTVGGATVFSVDNAGNAIFKGTVTQNGTP